MATIAIDARHIGSTTGFYIARLLEGLAEVNSGHRFVVLIQPKDSTKGYVPDGMDTVLAPFPLYGIPEQTGLLRLLRHLDPDLVHFCMPSQPLLYRGLAITTFHDLTQVEISGPEYRGFRFRLRQGIARPAFKLSARKSALVLTPSEFSRQEVIRFAKVCPDRIVVTYGSAYNVTSEREEVAALVGKRFFLYVGTHAPYKNVKALAIAHHELRAGEPDIQLALAGSLDANVPGNAGVSRDWTTAQGFDGIVYPGYVSVGQLGWLYENALAYVFPSYREGFGVPGLEAMAYGTPVISSNATCLPEIYADAALYFTPADTGGLVSELRRVANEPDLRSDLIERGLKRVAEFSWRRMAAETLAAYEQALGQR